MARRRQWNKSAANRLWQQLKSGELKPRYIKDIGGLGWIICGTIAGYIPIHVTDFLSLLPAKETPAATAYFSGQGKL